MWKILSASFILTGMLIFFAHFVSAAESTEIIELDSLGNIYEPVLFDHAMHMDIASCASCHHHTTGTDMPQEDTKCFTCHKQNCTSCSVACSDCHTASSVRIIKELQTTNLFHRNPTGLKRAYHLKCLGCHKEMGAASGCDDCHAKKDRAMKVSLFNGQQEYNYTR
jgi:hypothetical protein